MRLHAHARFGAHAYAAPIEFKGEALVNLAPRMSSFFVILELEWAGAVFSAVGSKSISRGCAQLLTKRPSNVLEVLGYRQPQKAAAAMGDVRKMWTLHQLKA